MRRSSRLISRLRLLDVLEAHHLTLRLISRRQLLELPLAHYGHLQEIAGPEAAERLLYAFVSASFEVDLDPLNFDDDVAANEEFLVSDLCGMLPGRKSSRAAGEPLATRCTSIPPGGGTLKTPASSPVSRRPSSPLHGVGRVNNSSRAMFDVTTNPRPWNPPDDEMM